VRDELVIAGAPLSPSPSLSPLITNANTLFFSFFSLPASECVSEHGKKACSDLSGECVTERDGYYWVSSICVAIGVVTLLVYIIPTARRLQSESLVLLFLFFLFLALCGDWGFINELPLL